MPEVKKTITVCAECLTASCWKGIFMCDRAQYADITERTRTELEALDLEHPCYWETSEEAET
jgi:hypothetical protein